MTTAARDNLVFLIALLSVLVFVAGATLCVVGWRWLHREEPKPSPKPRAENRNKQVTAPAHTAIWMETESIKAKPYPAMMLRLPGPDVTEVRDPTRLDLLKHHTGRGWRAREERAS
jgi:hypothetical protein